jgi:hypothetical protein
VGRYFMVLAFRGIDPALAAPVMFDPAESAEEIGIPIARRALDVIAFEEGVRLFLADDPLDVVVNLVRLVEVLFVLRNRIPEVIVQGFLVVDASEDVRFDGAEDPGSNHCSVVGGVWVHGS